MDNENDNDKIPVYSFEEKQNLIGLFSILLEVDKRQNPERYKPKSHIEHESHNSSPGIG